MNQFTNYVELQAEKAENLSFCRGIKLLHIRDKVETMLGFIGKGGIFEEYTVHSIEHIDEMLKISSSAVTRPLTVVGTFSSSSVL